MRSHPENPRPADNPFGSGRIDSLDYRFRVGDIDSVLDRLGLNAGRGAIIGPHGSGKTTLLGQLADRIAGEVVRVRLNAETENPEASVRSAVPDSVGRDLAILIDGAEQLGTMAWWRLRLRIRKAGAIVITSHRPERLPTIYECSTGPKLLEELAEDLAPGVAKSVDLDDLHDRHNGNLRLCFRELYDRWAGRPIP